MYFFTAKDVLEKGTCASVGENLQAIQDLEKEKLTIVAAKHLDSIHQHFPALREHFSSGVILTSSRDYIDSRIAEIECSISEILEIVQEAKCEVSS